MVNPFGEVEEPIPPCRGRKGGGEFAGGDDDRIVEGVGCVVAAELVVTSGGRFLLSSQKVSFVVVVTP